jgi:hypothetical protein
MRKCKFLFAFLLLCLALLSASAGYGQTVLNAVGSSGVFATSGLAAVTSDPITGAPPLCGTNFWSGGSGSSTSLAYALDSRNAGIPHEPGTLWVAWDSDTAPTRVCTYLSVDSVVGSRLFLSQNGSGNATLNILAAAQYTIGSNKVSFAQDNTSCAASGGTLNPFVDITETSGTTATVTVHGGGNFGNDFANLAHVTISGSTISGFNAIYDGGSGHQPAIGGVTQLGPTQFTITTSGSALGTDNGGTAQATVTANCPGIPAAVYSAIAATPHFTMGFSDIRPEDAHAVFVRASCPLNASDPTTPCDGYSANPASPTGIKSSYSTDIAFGLDFALFGGTDPISTVPVPTGTIVDIGAVPIMIFANKLNTSACGLGNAAFKNVNDQDLQSAYRGLTGGTQDISAALVSSVSGCPAPLHVVEREVYSGTYNTFEYQVIRIETGSNQRWSQENGNVGYPQSNNNLGAPCNQAWVTGLPTSTPSNPVHPPSGGGTLANMCGNPLNIQTANYPAGTPALGPYSGFGGNRTRVIGTGQMVSVVNSNAVVDTLGYAFYSLGTFGGKANIKYLQLNGTDPLWPDYTSNPYGAGVFPTCTGKVNVSPVTFSCPSGQPTFDGIKNGSYLSWNVIRTFYYGPQSTCSSPFTTLSAGCLIQATQDQANPVNGNVRDYLPVQYCDSAACGSPVQNLPYFRAHYGVSGVLPHNGHVGPPFTPSCTAVPESGGDANGAIFPVQLEIVQINNIGCAFELTGYYQ